MSVQLTVLIIAWQIINVHSVFIILMVESLLCENIVNFNGDIVTPFESDGWPFIYLLINFKSNWLSE